MILKLLRADFGRAFGKGRGNGRLNGLYLRQIQ